MRLFARNMRTLCYHKYDTGYVMPGVPGTYTRSICTRIISLHFDAYVLVLYLCLMESYIQNQTLFQGAGETSPAQRYGHQQYPAQPWDRNL
jgi:hypothetical protein